MANTIMATATSTKEMRALPEYGKIAGLEAAWQVVNDAVNAGEVMRLKKQPDGTFKPYAIDASFNFNEDGIRELAYNSANKRFDNAPNTLDVRVNAAFIYDHTDWPDRAVRGSASNSNIDGGAGAPKPKAVRGTVEAVNPSSRHDLIVTDDEKKIPQVYVTDNGGEGDVLHIVMHRDEAANDTISRDAFIKYYAWRVDADKVAVEAARQARREAMARLMEEADADADADMEAAKALFEANRAKRIADAAAKLEADAAAAAEATTEVPTV